MIIRAAEAEDAEGVAAVLQALRRAGKRTAPCDVRYARSHYILHPDSIHCLIAVDNDLRVLGLQSLKVAKENNKYGTIAGWALIGTHIAPYAARRGLGRAFFSRTRLVAKAWDVPAIEAYIAATNSEGQAYYEAMGFRNNRRADGAICKSYKMY